MHEIMTIDIDLEARLTAEIAMYEYEQILIHRSLHSDFDPLVIDNYVWCSMFGMSGMAFSMEHTFEQQFLSVLYLLNDHKGYTAPVWTTLYEDAFSHRQACSLMELGQFMSTDIIRNEVEDMLLNRYHCTQEEVDELRKYENHELNHWFDRIFLAVESSECFEKAIELTYDVQNVMQKTFKFTGLFIETAYDNDITPEEATFSLDSYGTVFNSEEMEYANPIRGGGFSCMN